MITIHPTSKNPFFCNQSKNFAGMTDFCEFELSLFTQRIVDVPLLAYSFIKNLGLFLSLWQIKAVDVSPLQVFPGAFKFLALLIMFWFGWWRTKTQLTCPWDINWMRIYFTKREMTRVLPLRNESDTFFFFSLRKYVFIKKSN